MSTQERLSRQNRDIEALHYLETQVLLPGEKIVWKGRPDARESAKVGLFRFFFGIFFFSFSLFWMYMATSMDGGLFALFGLPFVAVGFWLVSGPARNYLKSARTYYAITNQRVITLIRGKGYAINAITPDQMTDYKRTDQTAGFGSIRLKTTVHQDRNGNSATTEYTDGLWGIQDIKGAADAISKLRLESR